MKRLRPHQHQPLWYAFIAHRVSGLLLAVFLPAHFYVLSLALNQTAALDSFLNWAEHPLVKASEFSLVFLLALHLFGGLRLLALEFLPWHEHQKNLAALAVSAAFCVGLLFLLNAF